MADIINILPDNVANQIAAGEVIQRPASVVKELLENAIDAGADRIKLVIKNSGKDLIQVIDNGSGMSATDARIAFERHATSKITRSDDLFNIHTKGFRGEALASIAAVAQVELKTRLKTDELGQEIVIHGSEVVRQELVNCSVGSNFLVKNLFYNVPARRKFLKKAQTEYRYILTEFYRVALAHPELSFALYHNDSQIFHLTPGNLRQRIIAIKGKSLKNNLLEINESTPLIKISGYVAKASQARKSTSDQFFFVNHRFMKHSYFQNAVKKAYEGLIADNQQPVFFLYFEVDPAAIDVNIHPAKIEINFEDAPMIYSMLLSAVKHSLGQFNETPPIDFDTQGKIDIPYHGKTSPPVSPPEVDVNPFYNPFNQDKTARSIQQNDQSKHWEKLYEGFEQEGKHTESLEQGQQQVFMGIEDVTTVPERHLMQLKRKYVLLSVKSGLMIIDQHRAHQQILYEQFLSQMKKQQPVNQQLLYPATIELSAENFSIIEELQDELQQLGFDIIIFGKLTIKVSGMPADLSEQDPQETLENLIAHYKSFNQLDNMTIHQRIAWSLAEVSAITYGRSLSSAEMNALSAQLLSCSSQNYTLQGKPILKILETDTIERWF